MIWSIGKWLERKSRHSKKYKRWYRESIGMGNLYVNNRFSEGKRMESIYLQERAVWGVMNGLVYKAAQLGWKARTVGKLGFK